MDRIRTRPATSGPGPSVRLPIVYPITDRALAGGRSHPEIVRLLAEGGATLIQVREKEAADREFAAEVRRSVDVPGVRIIVNDRPDIALVAGAAGVHLGEDDLPAGEARGLLGAGAILGVSTHSVDDAVAACALDVDYVALGPIYPTPNASRSREPLGVRAVAEAAARMSRPLVAIGGISLERAPEVLAAGAAAVAVISDIMTQMEIPARVRAYLDLRPRDR